MYHIYIYSYMALCNKPPSSHCFATWNGTGCQAAMQTPKAISGSQHFFLKKLIPDYCNTYPSYSKRWKRTKLVRSDRLTCPGTEIAPVLLAWLMWFLPTPLEYHKFKTNAYWNIYCFQLVPTDFMKSTIANLQSCNSRMVSVDVAVLAIAACLPPRVQAHRSILVGHPVCYTHIYIYTYMISLYHIIILHK